MVERLIAKIRKLCGDPISLMILLAILFTAFVSLIPLFFGSLHTGAELPYQLFRIEGIKRGLLEWHFPVRVQSIQNSGYGYANGIFNPDIFLYFPAVLRILGFSISASYKLFIVICSLFTGTTAYFCIKRLFDSRYAGLLAAVGSLLYNYRLIDIYTRADLGEVTAFIFLPLVVLGCYEIAFGRYKNWKLLAIGFAGILLSHVAFAFVTLGFLILCVIVFLIVRMPGKSARFISLAKAGGFSILLTIFFWLPLMEQLKNDRYSLHVYSAVQIVQLVASWITFIILIVLCFIINKYITGKRAMTLVFGILLVCLSAGSVITFYSYFKAENLNPGENYFLMHTDSDMNPTGGLDNYYVDSIGPGEYMPQGIYSMEAFYERSKIVISDDPEFTFNNLVRNGTTLSFDYTASDKCTYFDVPFLYYKGYKAYMTDPEGTVIEFSVVKGDNACVRILHSGIPYGTVIVRYDGTDRQHFAD
ncbi:MAG: hypothetical protein LBI03_00320, partial [Clostridiales bacterium]|nr:hypothetical protein [Clostridiales bacterium]